MSNATEIKQQYTLGELPELVKRLITESKFVTSPDCVIRFTAVPTEDWTKQERRAVNTALCLAVGQLPQAHGYFDGTLLESQFDQSDVLIKATTMASGDEHTIYITITTNRCKDLIADMTLSWLTCFVKLHDHSCQSDSKPTEEKETVMTEETSAETPITDALSEITRLLNDRYIGEAVRVLTKPLNCDDVEIRPGSVELVFFNKIVSCMRSKNVQYSFSQYDAPCFVAHGTIFVTYGSTPDENYTKQPIRDGMVRVVVGVTSPNGDQILLDAYVDPVNNTGFKLTTTPEKKEETMNKEPSFIDAVSTILTATDAALKRNDSKCIKQVLQVIWKPLFRNGKQIAQNHNVWNLLTQLREEFSNRNVTFVAQPEIYSTPTSSVFITIGSNKEDVLESDTSHLGEQVLVRVVENHQIRLEGWVDNNPDKDNKFKFEHKFIDMRQNSATYPTHHLADKLGEVVNYARQKGIMVAASVSIPQDQFYLNQNTQVQGSALKDESIWQTLVALVNELMALANMLNANASVNICTTTQGKPSHMRSQSFVTINSSMMYTQPNGFPSFTAQQPTFTPGMAYGFHPQNHMPHNPCQPGYMGGAGSPFAPQGGPTVQGFKSQPNS